MKLNMFLSRFFYLFFIFFKEVFALKNNLATHNFSGRADQAHDGICCNRLAAAGFPDQSETFALLYIKINAIDSSGDTVIGIKIDLQIIADGQDVFCLKQDHLRSRGSRISRRPSPRRLKPRMVIMIARPGKVEYHQAFSM